MSTLVTWDHLPARRRPTARFFEGIFNPVRTPLFRIFFVSTLVGSLGGMMGQITAVWFMTEMTKSPLMVSLVTTAFSVPGFLLALPAGALGDIFDRRRLLFYAQSATAITIALLAMLTLRGLVGPVVLLISSALCGAFSIISATSSDAILPQIVGRRDFSAAIALMGFRYQFVRAIGPILGGVLIAYASIGHAFLVCSVAPFGMLAFLWIWHPTRVTAAPPAEHVTAALRAGIRYLRYAPQLTAVMIRVVAFIGIGSAMWALLPVYVYHQLRLDALQYGILFGCFGVGGMVGSVMAFTVNRRASEELVLAGSTIVFALNLFVITHMRSPRSLALTLFVGGVAWSGGMINLKTAVQMAAPDWVRARISAIYLLVLNGSIAIGTASWGLVASYCGTSHTMQYASVAMVATLGLGLRYRLAAIATVKRDRSTHRLAPIELPVSTPQEGMSILLTLEYQIDLQHAEEFEGLMHEVWAIRHRCGVIFWGLFADDKVVGKYSEYFVVESAVDAQRMHERMTNAEREILLRVRAFHANGAPPIVRYQFSVHGFRAG